MRIFHCESCDQAIYFENVQCVRCGHKLAYLADLSLMAALEPAGDGLWRALGADGLYRLCRNYDPGNVCNWTLPAGDDHDLCRSCRLTRTLPDLSQPPLRGAWSALESAKRRLVYDLLALKLPLEFEFECDGTGARLTFDFLADPPAGGAPIQTGHADGVITINVAEADDGEREKRRLAMRESYRTLLGHLRHESGHFYWDRLIRDHDVAEEFREVFGDERMDYTAALQKHYQAGPPADWQENFVSAYATSHPWEDWAETWAHYLHLTDTLDTACECGLMLRSGRHDLPAAHPHFSLQDAAAVPFDQIIRDWLSVTFLLNNLSRGLGQKDPYPFVISTAAIAKLEFVHRVCAGANARNSRQPTAAAGASASG